MDWVAFWGVVRFIYIIIAVLTFLLSMGMTRNLQKIFVVFFYHCFIVFILYVIEFSAR